MNERAQVKGQVVRTSILTLVVAYIAFGQVAFSAKWIGTWTSNPEKSKVDLPTIESLKIDPMVASQTLKIEVITGKIKLTSDTIISAGSPPVHEEFTLNLDGTETVLADGMAFSFKRIDDTTFDIIGKVNTKDTNAVGLNRFLISPDGKTLTETKTRVYREVVREGVDPATGRVLKSSTSILVFDKLF